MQNRRDLLQAHRLMTQRSALALLQAEPDTTDQPLRRINMGAIAGLLVAVMLAAGFGVWGMLSPGHAQGLDVPGALIIDSETGTPYVWCEHGKLCPAVNYASARLALGVASPSQRTVTQASLSGIPRGPLIGVPGLPQPLPDARLLVGPPWSVCVQTVTDPGTLTRVAVTSLIAGRSAGGRAVPGDQALLARSNGVDWLLWHGERMLIPLAIQRNVLTALAAAQPADVPAAWLNAFPQGPAIAPPPIAGFGAAVRGPGGGVAHIGQVFVTSPAAGAARQYYVLLRVGLTPVTPAQAALLDAAPRQVPQTVVPPSAVAGDRAAYNLPSGGLPPRLPQLVSSDRFAPLCLVYSGAAVAQPGTLTMGGAVPSGGLPIGGAGARTELVLPPGGAALAGVVPGPAAAVGPDKTAGGVTPEVTSYFLITGGRRYGLASPSVAAMLGYQLGRQRTLAPASVIDLIPLGPALDPSAARRQAPVP